MKYMKAGDANSSDAKTSDACMKKAIVVGTGAGGATIARELQGKYQVTILEAGREFKPFTRSVRRMAKFRKSGLFFDERLIRTILPNMLVEKNEDMVMVRGIGMGGTTTLATGNGEPAHTYYNGACKEDREYSTDQ